MSHQPIVFAAIVLVAISGALSFYLDNHIEEEITQERIIGGKIANRGQFPYQVSLRVIARTENRTLTYRHRCGGSIISERWIITAAHCTQQRYSNASNLVIVAGAQNIQNDGQVYALKRIVNHPYFNRTILVNDISLLETVNEILFDEFVQLIPLKNKIVDEGVRSVVSGWGQTDVNNTALAQELKYVYVYTLSNEDCRERHVSELNLIHNSTICTFLQTGYGSCFGDSGGPLVAANKLIGLVSWGIPCARGYPDAFTRVSSYLEWIKEETGVTAW